MKAILVHDSNGKGQSAVLIACYLIKLWECTDDYIINHLRLTRPISIENTDQEHAIKAFYESTKGGFAGHYARKQQPSGWDNKTAFLGTHNEGLLSTLPSYEVHYSPNLPVDVQKTQDMVNSL